MSNPRLLVDLDKIVHNTRQTMAICRAHGLEVMGVTKGAAGLPRVARAMLAGGLESLGDSRLDNIERLRKAGIEAPITLLRTPGLSDIDRTVELADASLNADLEVIAALSDAARAQNRIHHVILMVDLETGREGFAAEETPQACREVASLPGVRLAGLGAYFHLASGAGLHTRALSQLAALANRIETGLGKPLALLSGGSSNIFRTLAVEGHPNPGINHVRIGTAILLGFSSSLNPITIDGLERDTFVLFAEVIEVKNRRPGEAILALGKVDTDPQFLFPLTPGLSVKDATSDHLLVAMQHRAKPGDWIPFHLGYPALCRLTASSYVQIEYVSESGSC